MTSLTDIEKNVLSRAHYGEQLEPVRDWLILLGCFAVLLVVGVALNIWIYLGAIHPRTADTFVPNHAVNTGTIDEAEKIFGARAAEEANYQNAYHFVDPSQ